MDKIKPIRAKTLLWQKITLFISGILFALSLLEIGLRLGGVLILSLQEHRNMVSIRQKAHLYSTSEKLLFCIKIEKDRKKKYFSLA